MGDEDAKSQWHCFTDAYDPAGRSTRNPERHSHEFLQSFYEQFMKGMRFRSTDPALGYSKLIQAGLKSNNFKQQWEEYCDKCGSGINDPMKHSSEFHVNFLEYISQRSAQLSEMERESFKTLMQRNTPAHDINGDGDGDSAAKRLKSAFALPMGMMGL